MVAVVKVSWGRWVAHCPRPGCPGAEHYGVDRETGHLGGLTGSGFRCAHCGLICAAQWPPNVDAIARLLILRPIVSTRNWEPGETLHDLLRENTEHGCIPIPVEAADEPLISIMGDTLVAGFSLPAPDKLAIGGQ